MDKLLQEITDKLRKAYGSRLISVILYGSAAAGDHSRHFSDINILCVLAQVTTRELTVAEPIFRWWREKGNPAPLLMSAEEVRTSTDCFPIEFHDIQDRRRLLHGTDIIEELEIDDSFYRAQVEYQLRAKLLRLRQKGAGVLHDRDLLLRLLADSVSTFCVLIRHALRLRNIEADYSKRGTLEQARAEFQLDPEPFLSLLDLRDGNLKPRELDPVPLYERYLNQIGLVVGAVDGYEK